MSLQNILIVFWEVLCIVNFTFPHLQKYHLHNDNFPNWSQYILKCIFSLFFMKVLSHQVIPCNENSNPFNHMKIIFLNLIQRTCLVKRQMVNKRSKFVYQRNRKHLTLLELILLMYCWSGRWHLMEMNQSLFL